MQSGVPSSSNIGSVDGSAAPVAGAFLDDEEERGKAAAKSAAAPKGASGRSLLNGQQEQVELATKVHSLQRHLQAMQTGSPAARAGACWVSGLGATRTLTDEHTKRRARLS